MFFKGLHFFRNTIIHKIEEKGSEKLFFEAINFSFVYGKYDVFKPGNHFHFRRLI